MGNEVASFLQELRVKPLDDFHCLKTSATGTPVVDWNYRDTFYAKPRYPALDIAYLAVQKKWRNHKERLQRHTLYLGQRTLSP